LDGQYPIPAGRPNMEVRCGQDGKSENNCQLVRGLVHVGIVDEFKTNSKAENVILQGLTFFRATSVNVIAMIGGDITIKDCIFKVRKMGGNDTVNMCAVCFACFASLILLNSLEFCSD